MGAGSGVGGKEKLEFVIRTYRFSELGFFSDATNYLLVPLYLGINSKITICL
jgi:hypothetical protein